MVVWSVQKKEAICGSPASARSAGNPTTLVYSNLRDEMFISAGKYGVVLLEKSPYSMLKINTVHLFHGTEFCNRAVNK